MSRIIVITVPPPPPSGFTSTMASVVDAPEFDVRVEGAEMTFAEQAATLRAAADQLDPPATNEAVS